ncbi:LytTR family DNA-binding domain-containing protein [Listeria sp. ILCC797]|uniref:LytR/AlgR family response regulator transcription factor n=1 Tax=Listeria sp. ILCC797 TaxID=1918333 RepID=UPI0021008CF1|nr:LytTR family transcriptional regulator DNA-binding domain-containing protein [Listeria sp. ILCC797]
MDKMNIFLVEDDFLHREFIENCILTSTQELDIVSDMHIISNINSFINQLETLPIMDNDIYFLDIALKEAMSGIDIAELIRRKNAHCYLYFITSYQNKSLEIINRHILPSGYLIKKSDSLDSIPAQIQKIFEDIKEKEAKKALTGDIILKNGSERLFLRKKDIVFIQTLTGSKNYSEINCKNRSLSVRYPISALKLLCEDNNFYTNLKSFIINTNEINSIDRKLGIIHFNYGYELYASKKIIDKLLKHLNS